MPNPPRKKHKMKATQSISCDNALLLTLETGVNLAFFEITVEDLTA
jgi:hypothetical protein